MWPFEPATSTGAPGNVIPLRSSEAVFKRARYQTVGTRRFKCMSLATSALPLAVSRPETTQLLLPASPCACAASRSLKAVLGDAVIRLLPAWRKHPRFLHPQN